LGGVALSGVRQQSVAGPARHPQVAAATRRLTSWPSDGASRWRHV